MAPTLNPQQLEALALLAGIYPQEIPTANPVVVEAWARYLADIPADVLLAVVDAWNRSERRAPKPADILDRVATLWGDDVETAWAQVLRILTSRRWAEPGFACSDRMLAAVRAAGGWQGLRHMQDDERPHRKRDFIEGWRVYGQRSGAMAALGSGAGAGEPWAAPRALASGGR